MLSCIQARVLNQIASHSLGEAHKIVLLDRVSALTAAKVVLNNTLARPGINGQIIFLPCTQTSTTSATIVNRWHGPDLGGPGPLCLGL